jgi:UDP-N-acetylglucosamine 2-epimerase (non-hydrolysing)
VRIAIVQGTRPEIIKNYPVVTALQAAAVAFEVLHTNQHSAPSMCRNIYREMGYAPSRALPSEYGLGTAIQWLQKCFQKDAITHVIVNGDTAASLAGALAAMYLDIDVSHIEAGLRARDVHMREERNRIMVDAIAANLFAYTRFELELLQQTREIRGNVYVEGNTTVDVLQDFARAIVRPVITGRYIYVTLHRKELTDCRVRLQSVCNALRDIAETECAVVFPIHPRTRDALKRYGLLSTLRGVRILEPVTALESLSLQKHAVAVMTDSGCIQEEAYLLKVPCVTVRENTERHLTVRNGANVITGFAPEGIKGGAAWALALQERNWPDIYGKPGVGARIVQRLAEGWWVPASSAGLSYA